MKHIVFTNGLELIPSKIICVGRNYAKHIEEMNSTPTKEPVLFLKPNSALHPFSEPLRVPDSFGSVHHEIELAVCISKTCASVSPEEAAAAIAGYAVALDLTLRDMQSDAKKAGLPWAVAKGFDNACPISPFVGTDIVNDVTDLELLLKVNGIIRQQGSTRQMLFKIPQLIAYASKFFTFERGDLFLTGTPAGVGPLRAGDEIEASIKSIGTFRTTCI